MIWIFDSDNKRVGSFKSFEGVCDHFTRLEHLKCWSTKDPGEGRWDFTYWPHKRLSMLHEHLKDNNFSQMEREAYENEFDLIEIFDGFSELGEQYIVTPGLNTLDLMRRWCFDYAHVHGFTILETLKIEPSIVSSSVSLQPLEHHGFFEVF